MNEGAGEITRERILESIKLLKDWATWLVTIQTAAITALAALIGTAKGLTAETKLFAVSSSFCFLLSIIAASYLLVCLPAFYCRLPNTIAGTADFLDRRAFISTSGQLQRIKVIWLVGLEHTFFVFGVIGLFGLIVTRVWLI